MKKASIILFPILFLLFSITLNAQEEKYLVGDVALHQIEENWVEVRFINRGNGYHVRVYFGQNCGIEWVNSNICTGLKNESGEYVKVDYYLQGVNLLEENGFTLEKVIPDHVYNKRRRHRATFLFKKQQ